MATSTTARLVSDGNIECRQCSARLPLRLSSPGQTAALWECLGCGSPIVGVASADLCAETAPLVCLAPVHFDAQEMLEVPSNVLTLTERITLHSGPPSGNERRRSRRVTRRLHASAILMQNDYSLVSDPFSCLVIDLSENGLGCISQREPTSSDVAIQLTPNGLQSIQIIGRIVRFNAFGGGFYQLGIDFSFRLGNSRRQ